MTQAPIKIDTVMVGDIVVEKQVEAKSSYGEDGCGPWMLVSRWKLGPKPRRPPKTVGLE